MKTKTFDKETGKTIKTAQRSEITEHIIYDKLSQSIRDTHNKRILQRISSDELKHYDFWKEYTQEDVKPDELKIWKYFLISRIFGITFGLKLMERGEELAQATYEEISKSVPAAEDILRDENEHEKQLLDLIDEERLKYIGAIVRGLSDALVELTGALSGLTLVLQNTRLIGTAGLITGIAASLSMAGSEYLATKSEEGSQSPFKASVYTGSAYLLTVLFLIFPYLLFTNYYFCLGFMIFNAIVVIFIFTFYISVARDISFRSRFLEMTLISLGIAALTFGIGFLIRTFLGIEI
jgi:VIT1/CCC1 family predicted Fe2+/Mn2+ transporter